MNRSSIFKRKIDFQNSQGSYLFDKDTKEQLVIIFPIGQWKSEKVNEYKKIVPKKKEEFDLDEYLKKNKGKGRMINANITKVGD